MVDWVVFLTPVLVLAVVALLGFAGCGFESKAGAPLRLLVRVPAVLTVTEVVFRWTPPGGTPDQEVLTNPTPSSTEGTDNVFDHDFWDPPVNMWMTNCRVTVQEGADTMTDGAQGDFLYDGSQDFLWATYQASWSPSEREFTVAFAGALEPVSA